MTVAEVAKALGLSEGRVRVICQQGCLGQRVAGVWLITTDELEAFKRHRRGPLSAMWRRRRAPARRTMTPSTAPCPPRNDGRVGRLPNFTRQLPQFKFPC